jgi:MinD-like ATPase involved in chromosome partitioning or flagellar assembly
MGAQEARRLKPAVEAQLRTFGDIHQRIQVIASPFGPDAHCGLDQDFAAWAQTLLQPPAADTFLIWVFRHIARPQVVESLVWLAQGPAVRVLVAGEQAECLDYVGTTIDYLPTGPPGRAEQLAAVAFVIAEAALFRFPTPTAEPMLPWALLARSNYHAARDTAARAPSQAATKPGSDRRWPWSKSKRGSRTPPPRSGHPGVRELIPSHVPLTITVTASKDGVGKTSTALGLLLAAQEAAPLGMPILALDSEARQAGLAGLLGVDDARQVAVWDVMGGGNASAHQEPADSRSGIYVYQQAKDIDSRALDSMFDPEGRRKPGLYDLRGFMERVHRKYPIVVVDASSHRDVSLLWAEVSDAVVVVTDASPPTVAATQELIGLLLVWRAALPERAQLPVVCAWSAQYRPVPDVSRRRRKIESGFELSLGSGEFRGIEGIPVVDVPRDRQLYAAFDYTGYQRAGAMQAYRDLFARLISSMGTRRLRA